MNNLYDDKEYADKAIEANSLGEKLYVYVHTETEGEEEVQYAELKIAPVGYYLCYFSNYTNGEINPDYEANRIEQLRKSKLDENDNKANAYLQQTFTVPVGEEQIPCQFIYNEKTERNLSSSALGFITGQYTEKEWTDEQGITVYLTAEDVAKVFLIFNAFANAVWAKWGTYKQTIDTAETYEELEAIIIDFSDIDPAMVMAALSEQNAEEEQGSGENNEE